MMYLLFFGDPFKTCSMYSCSKNCNRFWLNSGSLFEHFQVSMFFPDILTYNLDILSPMFKQIEIDDVIHRTIASFLGKNGQGLPILPRILNVSVVSI